MQRLLRNFQKLSPADYVPLCAVHVGPQRARVIHPMSDIHLAREGLHDERRAARAARAWEGGVSRLQTQP
jgi:hypothetical protein